MKSTHQKWASLVHAAVQADWRAKGLRYHAYNFYLRNLFGHRVQHVSINGGFTCPNVDGTVAIGGCVFCDNRSFSPSRRGPRQPVTEQIDEGVRRIKLRYKVDEFLAYFQPATNTYAPVDVLRPLFTEALSHPQVVGLVIGTRPDCVPDDVLDLLEELAADHYLAVEYGVQTSHDRSLDWMNRGHHYDVFLDAMQRSRGRGFEIGAHVILGLPGESRADMLATAAEMTRVGVDVIKMHNLYAVKGTPYGEQVAAGELSVMELDDYISTLVDFLELLPSTCVVQRISGEAPPDYLIAPQWCLDKPLILKTLDAEFTRRDTWQGKLANRSS